MPRPMHHIPKQPYLPGAKYDDPFYEVRAIYDDPFSEVRAKYDDVWPYTGAWAGVGGVPQAFARAEINPYLIPSKCDQEEVH